MYTNCMMYNNVTLCTISDWFISFKRVRVTLYSAIDDCPIIKNVTN